MDRRRPPRDRQSAPLPNIVAYDDFAREAAASKIQHIVKSPDRQRRRATLPPAGTNAAAPSAAAERRARMIVGVRVRPLSTKEAKRGSHSCLTTAEGTQMFAHDPDDKM